MVAPERSAALIAGLTVASRVAGLVRTLVATSVLGITYLGNTYASANAVPNLLFEIFAGGVLAAVLVPSIAAPLARGDRERTGETASGFASRALLLVSGVVVAGLVLRGPLMAALVSSVEDPAVRAAEQELGEFLLLMFLPQIWLYAIGVVLTGVLHAHSRFGGPALAPLLSSVVVTISYLAYWVVEGPSANELTEISSGGRLILGLGTTAGVAVLSLSLIIPVRKLGLPWRITLRLPAEAASITRRLVGSALIGVAAQQVLLAAVVVFANSVEGGVVAYQLAFTLLLLPWAVLAVPLATASFPGLAAAAAQAAGDRFAGVLAEATRNVVLISFGGAAVLAASAAPLSRAMAEIGIGSDATAPLVSATLAAFAPGLIGYSGYALGSRAAYAAGDGRSPALAALAGFGGAAALDVVAAAVFEGNALIGALAGSFSIGMAVASGVLLVRLRGAAGAGGFQGLASTALRGAVAGAGAAAAGLALARVLPSGGAARDFLSVVAVAAVVGVVYAGGQRLLGDRQMTRVVSALRGSR